MQNSQLFSFTRPLLLICFLTTTAVGQDALVHLTKKTPPAEDATKPASKEAATTTGKKPKAEKSSRKRSKRKKKDKKRPVAKGPLSAADYAQWESIDMNHRRFSNDGK